MLFCVVCFAENDTVYVVTKHLNETTFEYEENSMESFIKNEFGDTLQKIVYWWENEQKKWKPQMRYNYAVGKEQEVQQKWDDEVESWMMIEMEEVLEIDTLSVSCLYIWDELLSDWTGINGRAYDNDGSIEYFDGAQKIEQLDYQRGVFVFKWDQISRSWYPNSLETYSGYDVAGNLVNNTFKYDSDRNGWVMQEKTNFEEILWSKDSSRSVKDYYKVENGNASVVSRSISYYDEFGQMTLDSSFSITENGMELSTLTRNKFVNDTLLEESEFYAIREQIAYKDVMSYDEEGNLTQRTNCRFSDDQWHNSIKSEYVYNVYGQMLSIDSYLWSKIDSSWNRSSMTILMPFENDSIWVTFRYNKSEQRWNGAEIMLNLYEEGVVEAVGDITYFYDSPDADPVPLSKWYWQNDSTVVYNHNNDQWYSKTSLDSYANPAEFYKDYLSEDKPVAIEGGMSVKPYLHPTVVENSVTVVNPREEMVITVYDQSSTIVYSATMQRGETIITFNKLASGMYYAKLGKSDLLQFVKK